MDIQTAIKAVISKQDLHGTEMATVMRQMMTGACTPAQIGGFLVGLRMKGESVAEISAAAAVMRELSQRVNIKADYLVDTCGTGGDSSSSFNISTASAIVAAAAGAQVAKHGNRAVSSQSGSADVLEAAGVNLNMSPEQVADCIKEVGVGFLFAPGHHSAMRHAIAPRREMAVRTIFNILGPLTNPVGALNQVIGVFDPELLVILAQVLKQLGSHHVMVVHADDGMDEISISGQTRIAELKDGEISCYQISPRDFGIATGSLNDLKVDGVAQSLQIIRQVFDNQAGAALNIVCLNAGAAIYVSGIVSSLEMGIKTAQAVIAEGLATKVFDALVMKTQVK